MITLDQIRMLDAKVQKAVGVIEELREENTVLRDKLLNYESKISELQVLIDSFKADQGEIESGIQKALERLDEIAQSSDPSGTVDAVAEENDTVIDEMESVEEEAASDEIQEEESFEDESAKEETVAETTDELELDNDLSQNEEKEETKAAELDIF